MIVQYVVGSSFFLSANLPDILTVLSKHLVTFYKQISFQPIGMATRPVENFKVSKAQTPFIFLGQMESTCQILGHLAAI